MIVGIGTDLCAVERFARLHARWGARLAGRVLHASEESAHAGAGNAARDLAKRFAVKEAVAKALGTGFADGVAATGIALFRAPAGQPRVVLHDGAARVAERLGVTRWHVSLTDDGGFVAAFAVAEGDEPLPRVAPPPEPAAPSG